MLKQRIITAAWLAPLVLAGLFGLQGNAYALFTALIVLFATWEWSNLACITASFWRATCVIGMGVLMLLLWLTGNVEADWLLWAGALGWLLSLYWVIHYPDKISHWQSPFRRLAMGVWVLLPCWVGFNVLAEAGSVWLLFVLLLVWSADIGAYFAGRAFGRRKLASNVSPGKSWEGVMGGMTATLLLALVVGSWQQLGFLGTGLLMLITLAVTLASVLGDLLESMLKRYREIKDSSQLLPGHGGVLDRIDSLTAAIPLFALLSPLVSVL